jgi:hypothetical protein
MRHSAGTAAKAGDAEAELVDMAEELRPGGLGKEHVRKTDRGLFELTKTGKEA